MEVQRGRSEFHRLDKVRHQNPKLRRELEHIASKGERQMVGLQELENKDKRKTGSSPKLNVYMTAEEFEIARKWRGGRTWRGAVMDAARAKNMYVEGDYQKKYEDKILELQSIQVSHIKQIETLQLELANKNEELDGILNESLREIENYRHELNTAKSTIDQLRVNLSNAMCNSEEVELYKNVVMDVADALIGIEMRISGRGRIDAEFPKESLQHIMTALNKVDWEKLENEHDRD